METKTKSSYQKGKEFEDKFAKYLKTEMKYDRVKTRSQINAAQNSRGSNIDIIGERPSEKGKRIKKIGNYYIIISIALYAIGFIVGYNNNWNGDLYLMCFLVATIFMIGTYFTIWQMSKNEIEHLWVECKNLKPKANINQVRKMLDEMAEYKASGDKKYKFYEFIFVSANGFVDNAIQLAEKNNIQCFVNDGKSFKQVTEWS